MSSKKISYDWNSENFRTLVNATGASLNKVAEALNLNVLTLRRYLEGEGKPSIDNLITIADFFSVPLDFLCGRCDEKTAHDILDDYEHTYDKIRRKGYENILFHKTGGHLMIPDGYYAPWPYNLVDDIFQEPADSPLSQDQLDGLNAAIDTLYAREQQCVRLYYEQYQHLEDIGKILNITRERVRQIIAKGIRKLRHPSRVRMVRDGLKGCDIKRDYEVLIAELNAREEMLNRREELLNKLSKNIEEKGVDADIPKEVYEKSECSVVDVPEGQLVIYDDISMKSYSSHAFDNLELSVRAYNCLRRGNYNTIRDIIEGIKSGEIIKTRNLGRKCLEEIIAKVSEYVDYDVSKLWDVKNDEKSA